jgi:hypothetical protein
MINGGREVIRPNYVYDPRHFAPRRTLYYTGTNSQACYDAMMRTHTRTFSTVVFTAREECEMRTDDDKLPRVYLRKGDYVTLDKGWRL